MEVSESSSSMRVQNRRINVRVIVINISPLRSLVNQAIFQHILPTQEDRKPLVITNVLILSNVDATSFLEDHFVVPLWIDALKVISDPVVLTEEDDLKDCETWILVNSDIATEITLEWEKS